VESVSHPNFNIWWGSAYKSCGICLQQTNTSNSIGFFFFESIYNPELYPAYTQNKKRCGCNKTRWGMGMCIPGLLCEGCTVSEETEVLLGWGCTVN